MQVTKENILLLSVLLILTFAFGKLESFVMAGYNDCRWTHTVLSYCADESRLFVSDSLVYLSFVSAAMCLVLPILKLIRERQRSRAESSLGLFSD